MESGSQKGGLSSSQGPVRGRQGSSRPAGVVIFEGWASMKGTMRARLQLAAMALSMSLASAAWAGPPYATDDPEPTDTGHWEIYVPLFEAEGSGEDFEGSLGAEINYGAARDLQITVGLPAAYAHDAGGWHWGAGDLEVSAKYRFYHDENAGLQIAFFPGVTLPTASNGLGAGRVTGLLPLWVQKDFGDWSLFGGGGWRSIRAGNRDYMTGAWRYRRFGERLLIGGRRIRSGQRRRAGSTFGVAQSMICPVRCGCWRRWAEVRRRRRTNSASFVAVGMDF